MISEKNEIKYFKREVALLLESAELHTPLPYIYLHKHLFLELQVQYRPYSRENYSGYLE